MLVAVVYYDFVVDWFEVLQVVVEVVVEAYPYPISYRGHYYQRSGATNQELKGAALDRFMLRRQGKTWDGVPVPYLTVDDLDSTTFQSDR